MNQDALSSRSVAGLPGLAAAYHRHRYAVMFASLLVTMVSAPLLASVDLEGFGLKLVLGINLIASVLGMHHGRGRTALLVVTVAAIAMLLVPREFLAPGVSTAALLCWSGIAVFNAAAASRFVMRAAVVESEHVYAALGVYLLAGIFFGVLHWTIEQVWPGSYVSAAAAGREFRQYDGIYFSFVTLATLGYGDIVPVGDVARGMSIFEAVSGQLYLAVMIARLVASHLQGRPRDPQA